MLKSISIRWVFVQILMESLIFLCFIAKQEIEIEDRNNSPVLLHREATVIQPGE